ncbi:MAG: pilus assembly FimT family protein [Myxococcota bacterium]
MRAPIPSGPSRTAGFTLIELSIVVIIIAVIAGLAGPALMQAMAERRANQATLDVVRLVRNARSSAAAYGRAHLVRYDSSGLGRVDVYRGQNNRCNDPMPGNPFLNNWGARTATDCTNTPNCIDFVDLNESPYRTSSSQIQLTRDGGDIQICYEPTGVMMWRTSNGVPFSDVNDPSISGGVRFALEPQDGDGARTGVVRRVVLPLGGDARVLR